MAALLTWSFATQAASLSGRDARIIAKALGFLIPAPRGGAVAVIYTHGDSAAKGDADAIVALFGEGLASSGGIVTAKAMDADTLGSGSGFIAVILAAGADGTSTLRNLLSISAANDLVRSGKCVMAVHSEPRVDITVNRAAAHAAGVDFTSSFGMLVHEI